MPLPLRNTIKASWTGTVRLAFEQLCFTSYAISKKNRDIEMGLDVPSKPDLLIDYLSDQISFFLVDFIVDRGINYAKELGFTIMQNAQLPMGSF